VSGKYNETVSSLNERGRLITDLCLRPSVDTKLIEAHLAVSSRRGVPLRQRSPFCSCQTSLTKISRRKTLMWLGSVPSSRDRDDTTKWGLISGIHLPG